MVNGDRVRQARELVGMTQTELADAVGVKQSAIAQIEAGIISPSGPVLNSIALKTNLPVQFFEQDSSADFPLGSLLYRSHANVASRDRAKAHRSAQVLFDLMSKLADKVELPTVRIPMLSEDPRTAARLTRAALGLSPDSPIANLTSVFEKAGVWTFALPIELEGMDAFSAWAGLDRKRPVIAVLANTAGDRLRFSLAHELAHLVLHFQLRGQMSDLEAQANSFAGEFLFPESAVQQEVLPPVTLSSLAPLKPRWRISLQAIIKRAQECGVITERQYRYLFQQLSAKGWRKTEPSSESVTAEKPRLFRKVVEVIFGTPPNVAKIAEELRISPKLLRDVFATHAGKRESVSSESQHSVRDLNSKIVLFSSRKGRQ